MAMYDHGGGVEDEDDDGGDVQSYRGQWAGQGPRLSINCVAGTASLLTALPL